MRGFTSAVLALVASSVSGLMSEADYFYREDQPLVIAHRGGWGHFPEESIASFADAFYGGADFVELDLQVTRDGHLVCQHDRQLDYSTNIAEYANRFEDRRREDGHFYVADFDLAELRLLRRTQRMGERSPLENDKFDILTLDELIGYVKMFNSDYPRDLNSDRPAGLYIELKNWSTNLTETGYDTAQKLFDVLQANELSTVQDCSDKIPIVVQSFEMIALDAFKTMSDLPLVYLHGYYTHPDWEDIGTKYHGVGVDGQWVMNHFAYTFGPTRWLPSTAPNSYSPFMTNLHDFDLAVHVYTLRDDYLQYRSNAFAETQLYVDNGIDGVFTEWAHSTYELFRGFGSKSGWPSSRSEGDDQGTIASFLDSLLSQN